MNEQPQPISTPIGRAAALAHACCSPRLIAGRCGPEAAPPPPVLDPDALPRLRSEQGLTLAQLAVRLTTNPPAAASAEAQADMLVSMLARHVAALGGTLELVARFPDRSIPLHANGG